MQSLKKNNRKVNRQIIMILVTFFICGIILGTIFLVDILAKNMALSREPAFAYSEVEEQLAKHRYVHLKGYGVSDSGFVVGEGIDVTSDDKTLFYTFTEDEWIIFMLAAEEADANKLYTENEVDLVLSKASDTYDADSIFREIPQTFRDEGWTEEEIKETTDRFAPAFFFMRNTQDDARYIQLIAFGYGIALIALGCFIFLFFIKGRGEKVKKNEVIDNQSEDTPVGIRGTENMSIAEVQQAVSEGGKFIVFQYCMSFMFATFKENTGIQFIKKNGGKPLLEPFLFTLFTLLLGWWGLPWGPLYSVQVIFNNLKGGKDVTAEVMTKINLAARTQQQGL